MIGRPLVPALLSFIAGILASPFKFDPYLILIILIASLFVVLVAHLCKPAIRLELSIVLITFFSLGLAISPQTHNDPTLASILHKRQRVKLEGTVLEVASAHRGRERFDLLVQKVYLPTESRAVKWKARVTVYRHAPQLVPGQKILFSCVPRKFHNFRNPGCFDYENYMVHKGFAFSAPVSEGRRIVSLGQGRLPWPRNVVENLRRPLRRFFSGALTGDDLALYCALVLGQRNLISPQLREKFASAGLSHVLAVSGLHIGLVGWLAFFCIKGLLCLSYRLSLALDIKKLAAALTCIPILIYVSLSGFQVSAVRAMIMALAFLWSVVLAKEKDIWSTLCLSALVILSRQPLALYHISFQLSYLAVIGLIWLCPPLFKGVNSLLNKVLGTANPYIIKPSRYLVSLVLITLVAFFFLLPLNLYYFHRISTVALPANFAVVPILGLVVIPSGLASALIYPLVPFIAKAVLSLGTIGLHAILYIVNLLAALPFSSLWFITPNLFEMLLFYAFILLIFFWTKGKWVRVALACLALVAMADASYWVVRNDFNTELRISFLDVGHGNCTLVELPHGRKLLIDGGGSHDRSFDVGKMVVAPALWWKKISRIDYLMLTHPQSDHMNGLRFIARTFHPKIFFYNGQHSREQGFRELMNTLQRERVRLVIPRSPAERFFLDKATATFFSVPPWRPWRAGHEAVNNCSLVLRLSYGSFSALFPGDIEKDREFYLVRSCGRQLRSNVLLSPHHGSNTSNSLPFLQAVAPQVCIISCRQGLRLKFPDKEVIKRMHSLGATVLRTDTDGMVQIAVKGDRFEVRSSATHKDIDYQ